MTYLKSVLLQMLSLGVHDDGPKVIYYHDLGVEHTKMGTPLELFKAHVEIARTGGWTFVKDIPFQQKELQVCFDDGFCGIYDQRDFFCREKVFPTVFIAVDLVGRKGYLTWNEIRELQDVGFSFESHTWSHCALPALSSSKLKHELVDSKTKLEQQLERGVRQMCFPRGLFSPRVIDACINAGYSTLFTSMPKIVGIDISAMGCDNEKCRLQPRILAQTASAGNFRCLLRGGMARFARHYLNMHFVREDP